MRTITLKHAFTLILPALLVFAGRPARGLQPPPRVNAESAARTAVEILKTTTDPEAKWRAILILRDLQYQPAVSLIVGALSDRSACVRESAARALGEMRVAEAAKHLIELLNEEKDVRVIEQTSQSLRNLNARDAVPALKRFASHETSQVRTNVLESIARLGGRPEVPYLAQFLDDRNSAVQQQVAEGIDRIMRTDFGFFRNRFRGPGGGTGDAPRDDPQAVQKVKQWWAENKNQPELFWKKSPTDAQLDPNIPPAKPERYQAVRDAKDWANPYLVVRAEGVEVISKTLESGRHVVPVGELRQVLARLTATAWPYGRVAVVQEIGIRSGRDEEAIRRNLATVTDVLRALQVHAELWPSA